MLIRPPSDILPSEITAPDIYRERRRFIAQAGSLALAAALPTGHAHAATGSLGPLAASPLSTAEERTSRKAITTYNNFYELGTDKSDPAENTHRLKPAPWSVRVEGLVNKPRTFGIDELLKLAPLEERIYRMRCVEGWSMVIPWVGIPLASLLRQVDPQGSAKYVEFVSHYDKATMTRGVLDWPYNEALREAIELLGNEAADQLRKQAADAKKGFFSGKDQLDPADLSLECLRMVYRLLFICKLESPSAPERAFSAGVSPGTAVKVPLDCSPAMTSAAFSIGS